MDVRVPTEDPALAPERAPLLLGALLRGAKDTAIYVTDARRTILYWSQSAERLFGLRRALAEGTDAGRLDAVSTHPANIQLLMERAARHGHAIGQADLVRQGGQPTTCELTVMHGEDVWDGPAYVWFVKDISDVAKRQARLRDALRQNGVLKDDIETLTGLAMHDVLSAITAIQLLLADEAEPSDATQRAQVRELASEIREVTRSTVAYLDLHPSGAKETLALRDVVAAADAATHAERAAVSGAIAIEGDEVLFGYANLLQVFFVEILKNSWTYGARNLFVRVSRRGGRAHVHVDDDGPGLPADLLESAFLPRTRGRNSTGEGFGLAIARKAALMHNGYLTHDTSEEGCRFTLTLPEGP